MKQKIIFCVAGLIGGIIIGYVSQLDKLQDLQFTIDSARNASIVLNKQYNQLSNLIGGHAIGGNDYALACYQTLQKLFPEIMQVSKDLGLDCKRYNEDGTPLMIKKEDGQTYPIEGLPEEIKLTNE